MKVKDKLQYLQDNFFSDWMKTRRETETELSDKCIYMCICGRLATGLHETHCKRFRDEVNKITLNKLTHLIK